MQEQYLLSSYYKFNLVNHIPVTAERTFFENGRINHYLNSVGYLHVTGYQGLFPCG